MSAPLSTHCPAKVNLSLHVLGRRTDGYHELESLVVFADAGDTLDLTPDRPLGLTVSGPAASGAGPDADNLVLKAANALAARVPGLALGHFHLVKRLPAAAGLGGGSSDAAGALRLLARRNGLAPDDPRLHEAAAATGADVTVCLDPRPAVMRGIGHELERVSLPALPAVLVNPRTPADTRAVFRALGLAPGDVRPGAPHPVIPAGLDPGGLLTLLGACRNDLATPARAVAPVIADVERALTGAGAALVRMSGSGATVWAAFPDQVTADRAAAALVAAHPHWWVISTSLGAP